MKNYKLLKSFTLMESIIVITIISLVIPSIFTIIFVLVKQETKIYRLSKVKREGDYILNVTSNLIKSNALSIHSAEPPSEANEKCKIIETYNPIDYRLIFKEKEDYWFTIFWDQANEKISSYSSSTLTSINLNSSSVLIDNFNIYCNKSSLYSPPTVSMSFDICYKTSVGNCTSSLPEESTTLHYQTRIKLRNF